MRIMVVVLILVALLLGGFMAIQPAINGLLRWQVGGPAHAAMISTSVSTISLFVFVFFVQRNSWPPVSSITSAPWWYWTGGLLGAVYVAVSLVLVSRLGAAVAFSLVIFGQMISALILDHYGWLGVPVHEITPGRVVGVAMVVGGVALIRLL